MIPVEHSPIIRWVQHYTPEFERRWNRFAQPAGASPGGNDTRTRRRRTPGWLAALEADGHSRDEYLVDKA